MTNTHAAVQGDNSTVYEHGSGKTATKVLMEWIRWLPSPFIFQKRLSLPDTVSKLLINPDGRCFGKHVIRPDAADAVPRIFIARLLTLSFVAFEKTRDKQFFGQGV